MLGPIGLSPVGVSFFRLDQLQRGPQRRIFTKRKVAVDARRLLAQFEIADSVIDSESRIMLRFKAIEHIRGKKCLNTVTSLGPIHAKRDIARRSDRRILQCPMDLGLREERFVALIAAARRQEMELMAAFRSA